MFASILSPTEGLTVTSALLCTGASVLLGLVISLIYMAQGSYSKGFVITLAVLPVMVQMVIMMVNGNLGTGVAVLGAFSLIRFRSVPAAPGILPPFSSPWLLDLPPAWATSPLREWPY